MLSSWPRGVLALVDKAGRITDELDAWFLEISTRLNRAPERRARVTFIDHGATIPTTAVPILKLAKGLYRISYYIRVTRPGSVSSSVQVTLGWTDGAVAQTFVGALKNGNTTTTYESSGVPLVRADAETELTYAVAYANGGGATSMQFVLDVVVEAIPPEARL